MTFIDFFKMLNFIEFDRFLKNSVEFVNVFMTFIDFDRIL